MNKDDDLRILAIIPMNQEVALPLSRQEVRPSKLLKQLFNALRQAFECSKLFALPMVIIILTHRTHVSPGDYHASLLVTASAPQTIDIDVSQPLALNLKPQPANPGFTRAKYLLYKFPCLRRRHFFFSDFISFQKSIQEI